MHACMHAEFVFYGIYALLLLLLLLLRRLFLKLSRDFGLLDTTVRPVVGVNGVLRSSTRLAFGSSERRKIFLLGFESWKKCGRLKKSGNKFSLTLEVGIFPVISKCR